ncbi:MAG: hypothetical protein A2589_02475 [Candidatus Vogelbacteria bacterium RIFOXYD1_FULL_46_19]|uniref:DUF4446 domain-containing protein n=1 Tax=Candidatus Vogelbacteria bacterium RIFOXYD1_FULL_46_19 TaxID=1802439 RepID=A0A1G2QHE5_9BACT|nr:MAG: hypothetical protein A2589_02475 [Candidatus Vogelbacteria bacterium RIFOXYD1_FULL_46_19]
MNIDLFQIVVFLGLIFVLAVWIFTLEWRLKKLFRGQKGQDLEGVMADLGQAMDGVIQKSKHDDALFEDIYRRLRHTLQRLHTVRFNPFSDQGSNQSFATALMDEDGNGVVMSSLYSRDKVSIYAKPLTHFQSEYELSKEEARAIDEARRKS